MATLVTLAQAKWQLNVTSDLDNARIDMHMDDAGEMILTYLKDQAVAGWSDGTVAVPGNVRAAVLLFVEDLYLNRPLRWDDVHRLLVGLRDPALA